MWTTVYNVETRYQNFDFRKLFANTAYLEFNTSGLYNRTGQMRMLHVHNN